jgi:protein SCO1/2
LIALNIALTCRPALAAATFSRTADLFSANLSLSILIHHRMNLPTPQHPIRVLLLLASLLIAATPIAQTAQADFSLPAPGSYKLERIMPAPKGKVLNSDGKLHPFSDYSTGKVTLLSLIYTYCADPNGCPLAYATIHQLKKTLDAMPRISDKVRLVSMSFDPDNDTPQVMRDYGGADIGNRRGVRWHFLTTRSRRELTPLLDGFGQDVSVADEQSAGQRVPMLSHLLKVYLIDRDGQVREIYSSSFLTPQVLLNDIETLLKESGKKAN